MATRFYFPSASYQPIGITPAFNAGWTNTSEAVRRQLHASQLGQSFGSVTIDTAHVGVSFVLAAQLVCPRALLEQIITGTIKGQIRGNESATSLNATMAISVSVCDKNGLNIREILPPTAADDTSTTPPEFAASLTNRRLLNASEATPITLTDTKVINGDFLIVGIGFRENNVTAGSTVSFSVGDAAASDLPEDDTTTTTLNPWIEFSMDVQLASVKRLYFEDIGPTFSSGLQVAPAFGSGWNKTNEAVRRRLHRNSPLDNSLQVTPGLNIGATGVSFTLARQFVVQGLADQWIQGYFSCQIAGVESSIGVNASLSVRVAKCDKDGNNVVELCPITGVASEYPNTLRNLPPLDPTSGTLIPLTLTHINKDDCLIVEVGFRESTSTPGETVSFELGYNPSVADYTEAITTGGLNPWIEFCPAIQFVNAELQITS